MPACGPIQCPAPSNASRSARSRASSAHCGNARLVRRSRSRRAVAPAACRCRIRASRRSSVPRPAPPAPRRALAPSAIRRRASLPGARRRVRAAAGRRNSRTRWHRDSAPPPMLGIRQPSRSSRPIAKPRPRVGRPSCAQKPRISPRDSSMPSKARRATRRFSILPSTNGFSAASSYGHSAEIDSAITGASRRREPARCRRDASDRTGFSRSTGI
jgi:hypothetical protein